MIKFFKTIILDQDIVSLFQLVFYQLTIFIVHSYSQKLNECIVVCYTAYYIQASVFSCSEIMRKHLRSKAKRYCRKSSEGVALPVFKTTQVEVK